MVEYTPRRRRMLSANVDQNALSAHLAIPFEGVYSGSASRFSRTQARAMEADVVAPSNHLSGIYICHWGTAGA